jgi:hypothetical protein
MQISVSIHRGDAESAEIFPIFNIRSQRPLGLCGDILSPTKFRHYRIGFYHFEAKLKDHNGLFFSAPILNLTAKAANSKFQK